MEPSIRDAKAAAAARDEHVVATEQDRPLTELMPMQQVGGLDFEKMAIVRHELGLDGLNFTLPPDFDDPAFSRQVLGLPD